MFEGISEEIRLKILLKVVRNLIINSKNTEIFRLSQILEENTTKSPDLNPPSKEELKEKIKQEVKEKLKKPAEKFEEKKLNEESFEPKNQMVRRGVSKRREIPPQKPRVLRIPKISLPRHLNEIRPVPSERVSVELGKLDPFVRDPNVLTIETEGENEPLYVTGSFGRKPINVKLSKTEIEEVINRFSEKSKIPKNLGLFKVAVGKLLLTAMISDSVSPRFVLEKIRSQSPPQNFR
jgi:hypothetical protein